MRTLARTPLLVALAFSLGACSSPRPVPEDVNTDVSAPSDAALDAEDAPAPEDTPLPDAGRGCVRTRPARDGGVPAADAGNVRDPASITACNGSAALCDRRYDRVSQVMTHNSMSNADERWTAPNQTHGITRQLDDGVRGMMLDTHPYRNDVYLCHGFCGLGNLRLAAGLCRITQFLDAHPDEVVSIIFEAHVPAEQMLPAFEESGLIDYVTVHARGAQWPTLREMIARDRRLVAFTEDGSSPYPWYMPAWDYVWDTDYAAESNADFDCALNRGQRTHSLFLLNHFLTNPLPSPENAQMANTNPFFVMRAQQCQMESGRLPNFVGVDFYDIGNVFDVVRTLNGL